MSNPPRHLHAAGTARGRLDASAALVAGLAAPFTGIVFDPAEPVLAEICAMDSTAVLRTGALPAPMQREISWWLAACHDSGERVIDTCDWRRWTATAAEIAAGRPQVRSFADLTLAEWMTAWSRKFHADHGRLPAPGSRYRAETALRGLLPRLAIQYSDAPWWKHDVWCLRFDPRIPRREHEPRGESSVRWDDIQPRWLRDGSGRCRCSWRNDPCCLPNMIATPLLFGNLFRSSPGARGTGTRSARRTGRPRP